MGIDPVVAEKIFLKGQQAQQFVDVAPQKTHPALPPGPGLGGHIVYDRDALPRGMFGHREMEIRGVDAQHGPRSYGPDRFFNPAQNAQNPGQKFQRIQPLPFLLRQRMRMEKLMRFVYFWIIQALPK